MSRRSLILIVLLLLIVSGGARAGEPGNSGFVFLRLGNGARASGMGEAFTAVADGATSIYWNPAGMAGVEGVELSVTHTEWLVDIRLEQVSVVNEMFGGAVGLSFAGMFYGDMDRYDNYPSLVPNGTFAPYDLAVSGGYARDILPNLAVGASIKFIYAKIDFESARGWALDIGVTHKTMVEGLTLAASILNLGPQTKFVEEKFYPPLQLRGGIAYRYDSEAIRGNVILASDVIFPNDGDAKVHFGGEYNYGSFLSVRGGYKANYYIQGATFGLGVTYKSLRFDYGWMPMEFELGDSHRFSLIVFTP